ncbi:hypothetical protein H9649_16815 [Sporosarcina sp. Sa2YVA2]|uniref:Uncharacterized protein n=1 Tax=Sporosarcina quadrami TaxID=2762234 RepID=A0ABR8UF37_9BACL|nr:hypothetical protein [Sporosarcina quadrami]MBD7986234.1 hypothetical protein [Sporosarcina quadrami]
MNKTIQWVSFVLAAVAINIPAFLLASFTLFGTSEGTSIFSIDYAVAALIVILANGSIAALFLAINRNYARGFFYALVASVAEAICLYIVLVTFNMNVLLITGIVIVINIVLLIYIITSTKAKPVMHKQS